MMQLICLAILFSLIPSTQANLYLESASVFRSNVLQYHSTDHFLQNAEKFANRILNRKPTTSSSSSSSTANNAQASSISPPSLPLTHEEAKVFRPYIVKTKANCLHRCHDAIVRHFGHHHYDLMSPQYGVVTTSQLELEAFLRHHPDNVIVDYVPLHPEMKISPEIRTMMSRHKEGKKCIEPETESESELGQQQQEEGQHQIAHDGQLSTTTTKKVRHTVFNPDLKFNAMVDKKTIAQSLKVAEFLRRKKQKSALMDIKIRFLLHDMTQPRYEAFSQALRIELNRFNGAVRLETMTFESEWAQQGKPQRFSGTLLFTDCGLLDAVVKSLSNLPDVLSVERQYPIVLHNRWTKGLCDSGITEVTPLININITGYDEVIGISDTGIDMNNCYFYDPNQHVAYNQVNLNHRKVVLYMTDYGDRIEGSEGHGTHTSGSAAGLAYENYGDYEKFSGMAYNAKIAFADIEKGNNSLADPPIFTMFTKLATYKGVATGVKIFTNSWGLGSDTSPNPQYTTEAQQVDQYMWENPDALILFSASNAGNGRPETVSSPSTNKNGIAVGASLNDHQMWMALYGSGYPQVYEKQAMGSFTGQGPTADGRLKPDIFAPGYFVYSAKGYYNSTSYHCDIQGLSGTSMASPTMAGYAVKVRQYYLKGYYPTGQASSEDGFVPSGALIKATLMHSGQRLNYTISLSGQIATLYDYPSTVQGYGRIQLSSVLNFDNSTRNPISMFAIGSAFETEKNYVALQSQGDVYSITIHTPSTSSAVNPIRVTMCYTDYYGSSSANDPMQNVLSLKVTANNGHSYTPYRVSGTIQSNAQIIDIVNPTPATTYTVTVTGTTILITPQPFALVITGEVSYLNYTSSSDATNTSGGSVHLNYDTSVYIIVLAVLCFLLAMATYHIYRVVKGSIINDPANYRAGGGGAIIAGGGGGDNDFDYDFIDDEDDAPTIQNQTLFQKLFTRYNNRRRRNNNNNNNNNGRTGNR